MNKFDNIISNCKFCGSADIYKFHQATSGEQIYKCSKCRLQFMNPQLSNGHLIDYYSSYIRDESTKEKEMVKAQTFCLSLIEQLVPAKGNILDIGSGNGYLLKAAKDRGWNPIGHELDCNSAMKLSERINMKILCGEITSLKIDTQFDAVTMLHVLEHLKDPMKHIKYINSIMKKSAILFIALPNIHSRSALFKLALEKLKIKRKGVAAYYDTEHHLWYYTPFTIRKFLENYGFEVIRIYSGDNVKIIRKKFVNYIEEKLLSHIFWHSSMGVIAKKN